jgi:hypothetical protein
MFTVLVRYILAVRIEMIVLRTENAAMENAFRLALLVIFAMILAGCDIIVNIFQAGVWVGVILVILVIGLIVWLFTRGRT